MEDFTNAGNKSKYRGMIFVLEGLSGGGKTTLGRLLTQTEKHINFSVSATTRGMRDGDVDGVDYIFMSKEEFLEKKEQGYFLETTDRFGNYYGTPQQRIEDSLESGEDLIFDIDYLGARKLEEQFPHDVVRVFLIPPSCKELVERLNARKTETEETFAIRMEENYEYLDSVKECHYVFVNDSIQNTLKKLQQILRAERMKRDRQPWIRPFIENFKKDLK